MSEMARADLIYSENVYFIIQIQPPDSETLDLAREPLMSKKLIV